MWSYRPGPRGVAAGEGPGGLDRVREDAVPQPASALRTFAAASAGSARRSSQPHLPAFLHAAGGQDPHRDADPRHAAIGELHQLALHVRTVKAWKRAEAGRGQAGVRPELLEPNAGSSGRFRLRGQMSSHLEHLADVTPKLLSGKQKRITAFVFAALFFFF